MAERNLRKTRVGLVVSDKMDKTVVVAIVDNVKHPLYKKIVKRTVRLKAHDEKNECRVGDRVEVMETRPWTADKDTPSLVLVRCPRTRDGVSSKSSKRQSNSKTSIEYKQNGFR